MPDAVRNWWSVVLCRMYMQPSGNALTPNLCRAYVRAHTCTCTWHICVRTYTLLFRCERPDALGFHDLLDFLIEEVDVVRVLLFGFAPTVKRVTATDWLVVVPNPQTLNP